MTRQYNTKIASVVPKLGWNPNWASVITLFEDAHNMSLRFNIALNYLQKQLIRVMLRYLLGLPGHFF